MGQEAQIGHADRRPITLPAVSGNNPLDKMKNVYDLEGNYLEWTAEAHDINSRVCRGGNFHSVAADDYFYPASKCEDNEPVDDRMGYSSRGGLYLNI